MTLGDIANFSTALSGLAVTASLIYLAIQTRQNSRHTRALIQQGATARTTTIMLENQTDERCAAWLEENGEAATPIARQKMRFNLMCGTGINAMEDLYFQHREGLLTEELFVRNCEMFRNLMSKPGMREYWHTWRGDLLARTPNFCAFVDGLCSEEVVFTYRV